MSRTLCKYSDEDAAETIAENSEALAVRLARDVSSSTADARFRHYGIVARMYVGTALAQYQLEAPAGEVMQGLQSAAEWKGKAIELVLRGEYPAGEVWSLFLHDLGLVTAFGAVASRRAYASLSDAFVKPSARDDEEPGLLFALAWKRYLRDEQLERAALVDIVARCARENASRWDSQWTHGLASCFVALLERDETAFAQGLQAVARFTEFQALHGDWRTQPEGQMSLPALGLCRLARRHGLAPRSSSPYIPVDLLGED